MKISLFIFVALLCGFTSHAATEKLVIEGNVKVLSVGEGITCGMDSNVGDFKNVAMITNSTDTVHTTLNEKGDFKFEAIRKEDTFQIHFFYQSTNSYLNRTEYFVPVIDNNIQPFNNHRHVLSTPLLSDYKVEEQDKITTVFLQYGIYCLITPPYEPAGFKLMDYPVSTAPFQEIKIGGIASLASQYFKGQATVTPTFAMRFTNDTLLPVYAGFSLQQLNLENENGSCFKGAVNTIDFQCDPSPLFEEMHTYLKSQKYSFHKVMLSKQMGTINFTPSVFFKLEKNWEEVREQPQTNPTEDVEPVHHLNFKINNHTNKEITIRFGAVKKYAATPVMDAEVIKKNQTEKAVSVEFSMNNPMNYAAKIWLNSFPNELFESIQVYYGKKKIPLAITTNWLVEQDELTFNYTLNIEL